MVQEAAIQTEAFKEERNKEYIPTVTFEEAADEIWPQLSNPTPVVLPVKEEAPAPVKEEKPVKEAKPVIKEQPVKEQPVVKKELVPTVSFDDAADEIWPQLKNPKPLPKQEQPREVKPQVVKKKPAPVLPVKEEKVAPIKEASKKEYHPTVKFDDAADEIWPQLKNPTPLKQEVKEVAQEEKKPEPKKVSLPKSEPKKAPVKKEPVVKENKPAAKAEPKKEQPKVKETPVVKKEAKPQPKKEETPAPVVPERKKIPGRFIVKTPKGYFAGNNKYSINKEDAFVFDDYNLANDIKKEKGGKIVRV